MPELQYLTSPPAGVAGVGSVGEVGDDELAMAAEKVRYKREMTADFGFYPLRLDTDNGRFQIKTCDDFESIVKAVRSNPFVEGDWIYSPPSESYAFGTDSIRVRPYSSRVFGLLNTHTLSHQTNDPVRLRFLIWCFGFFVGMRMSDREAGFLDATPIKPGASNDIVWLGNSLMIALATADDFFTANATAPKIERVIRAAMHSYLASDVPTLLDYERFIHLYTAIDACYAAQEIIAGQPKTKVAHAERIAYLCEELGLPVPWWANRNSRFIATQRNQTLHEGLFFGEPWGFSIFGRAHHTDPKQQILLLEMQKLTCRIVIALLGVQDREYLTSSVSDRQRHGLRLKQKA